MDFKVDSKILEKNIIAFSLQDSNFFLNYAKYLTTENASKKSYFSDPKMQRLLNIVGIFNKKYKSYPSKTDIEAIIEKSVEDTDLQGLMFETINEIYNTNIQNISRHFVEEETKDFILRVRAVEATILNQADIENGNYTGLTNRMREALSINFDKDLGVSIKDVDENLEIIKEVTDDSLTISLGFPTLEREIGRLSPEELIVFCGVPGAGKTLWLGQIAINAFMEGKKVALFSLETSKKRLLSRFYQNFFNREKIRLLETSPDEPMAQVIKNQEGDIRIINYQAGKASCDDFSASLRDLQMYKNWEPDLILVDYILITSTNDKRMSKDNSFKYYKTVAEEMRNLGVEWGCPVISASQINREGMSDKGGSKAQLTSKDLSESRGILDTADYVLMIEQTANEKYVGTDNKGKYRIGIDKNRNGATGKHLPFVVDWTNMSITEQKGGAGKG